MRTPFRFAVVLALAVLPLSACGLSGAAIQPHPRRPQPDRSRDDAEHGIPHAVGRRRDPAPRPAHAAGRGRSDRRRRRAREGEPRRGRHRGLEPGDLLQRVARLPEEGDGYTQALVEGEVLMLRTNSSLFQYTGPTGGPFSYCADPNSDYTVGG